MQEAQREQTEELRLKLLQLLTELIQQAGKVSLPSLLPLWFRKSLQKRRICCFFH